MKTIFKKIIDGELPAEKVFENERILVIKDIHPVAPVHLLIIPKKEIVNLQALKQEEMPILAEVVALAQQLAVQYGIEEGYRFITNNGAAAGQIIFHLHFHLIGGHPLKGIG